MGFLEAVEALYEKETRPLPPIVTISWIYVDFFIPDIFVTHLNSPINHGY